MQNCQNHFVYFMTNKNRTVLYVGVTSSISERVYKHFHGLIPGFSAKYNCRYLIYFEQYNYIINAIKREKQIKGWRREKKLALIASTNPNFKFLNADAQSL